MMATVATIDHFIPIEGMQPFNWTLIEMFSWVFNQHSAMAQFCAPVQKVATFVAIFKPCGVKVTEEGMVRSNVYSLLIIP